MKQKDLENEFLTRATPYFTKKILIKNQDNILLLKKELKELECYSCAELGIMKVFEDFLTYNITNKNIKIIITLGMQY